MLKDATVYRDQGEARRILLQPEGEAACWCASVHWTAPPLEFRLPTEQALVDALPVRVERGAWIVDCPCGGAQFASRTDHRVYCPDCLNEWAGGAWVATAWPAEVDEIERLLLARSMTVNRNWVPGETTADLQAENDAHGVVS